MVVKLFKAQHREAKLYKVVLRTHKEVAMMFKDPQDGDEAVQAWGSERTRSCH